MVSLSNPFQFSTGFVIDNFRICKTEKNIAMQLLIQSNLIKYSVVKESNLKSMSKRKAGEEKHTTGGVVTPLVTSPIAPLAAANQSCDLCCGNTNVFFG